MRSSRCADAASVSAAANVCSRPIIAYGCESLDAGDLRVANAGWPGIGLRSSIGDQPGIGLRSSIGDQPGIGLPSSIGEQPEIARPSLIGHRPGGGRLLSFKERSATAYLRAIAIACPRPDVGGECRWPPRVRGRAPGPVRAEMPARLRCAGLANWTFGEVPAISTSGAPSFLLLRQAACKPLAAFRYAGRAPRRDLRQFSEAWPHAPRDRR